MKIEARWTWGVVLSVGLAACGQAAEAPEDEPVALWETDEVPGGDQARDEQDELDTPGAPAQRLVFSASSAGGPGGGTYEGLWAAGGAFLSLGRDVSGRWVLWRSGEGEAWEEVAMPEPHDGWEVPLERIIERDGEVLALTRSGAVYAWVDGAWARRVAATDGVVLSSYVGEEGVFAVATVRGDRGATTTLWALEDHAWREVSEVGWGQAGGLFETFAVVPGGWVRWSGYGPLEYSADEGASWSMIPLSGEERPLLTSLELHEHDGDLVVVTDRGTWRVSGDLTTSTRLTEEPARASDVEEGILYAHGFEGAGFTLELDAPGAPLGQPLPEWGDRVLGPGADYGLAYEDGVVVVRSPQRGLSRAWRGAWEQAAPQLAELTGAAWIFDARFVSTSSGDLYVSWGGGGWSRFVFEPWQAPYRVLGADRGVLLVERAGEVVALEVSSTRSHRVRGVVEFDGRLAYAEVYRGRVYAAPEARGVIHGGGLYAQDLVDFSRRWSREHDGLPWRSSLEFTVDGAPHVASVSILEEDVWAVGSNVGIQRRQSEGGSWFDVTPVDFMRTNYASDPLRPGSHSLPAPYRYWIEHVGEGVVAASDGATAWWTRDGGETWSAAPLELPEGASVTTMGALAGALVVGTDRGGLFTLDLGADAAALEPIGEGWTWGRVNGLSRNRDGDGLIAMTQAGLVALGAERVEASQGGSR